MTQEEKEQKVIDLYDLLLATNMKIFELTDRFKYDREALEKAGFRDCEKIYDLLCGCRKNFWQAEEVIRDQVAAMKIKRKIKNP